MKQLDHYQESRRNIPAPGGGYHVAILGVMAGIARAKIAQWPTDKKMKGGEKRKKETKKKTNKPEKKRRKKQ
jgi:formiminotetrahydrofolate cyclodeaminase